MSDLLGYISSFFVTFGLGVGFFIGGLIFAFLFSYAVMLLFKKSRLMIREQTRVAVPVRKRFLK